MKKFAIIIIFTLILILTFCITSAKCDDPIRPEIIGRPDFKKAFYYHDTSQAENFLAELRRVADENRGNDVGGTALIWLSRLYGDKEKALQVCQEMIRDYPNTRYWYLGKMIILAKTYKYDDNFDIAIRERDKVIEEIGGAKILDILSGNANNFDVRSVPVQFRDDLANTYYYTSVNLQEKENYKAIDLLIFIRENFPRFNWEFATTEIKSIIIDTKIGRDNWNSNKKYRGRDKSVPIIRPIAPHDCLEIGETRPKIEVEMEKGDIKKSQIDLSKTIFTLDGKDLTEDMKVESQINKSGRLGVTFEKLRLMYYLPCDSPCKDPHDKSYGHSCDYRGLSRYSKGNSRCQNGQTQGQGPTGCSCGKHIDGFRCSNCSHRHCTSLSPGWHTVYIKAFDYGGRASEKTWRFYVKR
jgi:hypothetical protein